MRARVGCVGAGVALLLVLTGCVNAPRVVLEPEPSATATVTATETVTVTPSPSAPPTGAAADTSPEPGCTNGPTEIPEGADVSTIADVDGDGLEDRQYYSEAVTPFVYGIVTSAGGLYSIQDELAGPGRHSGWTALFDGPTFPLTVLDDGRSAQLYAFVDCAFVRTETAEGEPYRFTLAGSGDGGTGVACNDRNGGVLLERAEAVERADGRFDVRWTQLAVGEGGRTAADAEGATPETRYADLDADDPRVAAAKGSFCGDVPKVATSGR